MMKKRIISLLLALVLCLGLMPMGAMAAGEDFVIENGVLTQYTGSDSVIVIPDGVTAIGNEVFTGRYTISSVTIPDTVTSIGKGAFKGCTGLKSITVPGSVTVIGDEAFSGCSGAAALTLGEGLIEIGEKAFYYCIGLSELVIPDSVTRIKANAFNYCYMLRSVHISESVTAIEEGTFFYCHLLPSLTIPASVTSIGKGAFEQCSALTDLIIPEGVVTIGEKAFRQCRSMVSVSIPSSVTTIGNGAFAECGLVRVVIPEGVTTIGESAFYRCTGLEEVSLPQSLTSIGDSAFYYCGKLKAVDIPGRVTAIGSTAFSCCQALGTVTLGEGVETIGQGAFSTCPALTSLSIPSSVTEIGDRAFSGCTGLKELTLRESLKTVGKEAFSNCALETLTVPVTVTAIGGRAFEMTSLKTVYLNNPAYRLLNRSSGSPFGKAELITPPEFDQFVFSEDNSSYRETGILIGYTGSDMDVVVPRGVSLMDLSAFRERTDIRTVTLPDTLTEIPRDSGTYVKGSFYGCAGLEAIYAPDHLKEQAAWEMAHKDFELVQSYTGTGTGYQVSRYVGKGGGVVLPDEVTSFNPYNFVRGNWKEMTSITLPDGVRSVPLDLFSGCTKLSKVAAKESSGLTLAHFRGCTSMTVEGLPEFLRNVDPFQVEGTKLVGYEGLGGNVVLPEGVTDIAPYVFSNYYGCIETLTFPSTLVTFQDGALSSCGMVTLLVLPAGFDFHNLPPLGFFGLSDTVMIRWGDRLLTRSEADQLWEAAKRENEETYRKEQEVKQQEEAKNAVQQMWETAYENNKGNKAYLDRLEENRAFITNYTQERFYKYTWVTDDIQALSDELSNGLESDYDKVMAFHDWATENIYYDYEAYYGGTYHNSPAQEVLDERKCVCNGYAFFMQAMCWAQKIPALYVTGMAGGYHGWNLIKIDDEWRWMDATWDTSNGYYGGDQWNKGSRRYTYCLCPSEYISTDHTAKGASLVQGINVSKTTYYAFFLDPDNRGTCLYNGGFGDEKYFLSQGEIDEINALRAAEGLLPVKPKNDNFWIYYPGAWGYDDEDDRQSTDGPKEEEMVMPVDPEEEERRMEEEIREQYEDQHLGELKELLGKGDQVGYLNTDLYPDTWAMEEVVAALEAKLVPTEIQSRYTDAITRLEFCRLMVRLVERNGTVTIPRKGNNPFTDVFNDDVTAAYYLGIVKGVGDDRFNPNGSITRQEAATMLARAAKVIGLTDAGMGIIFGDSGSVAPWASEAVDFISGLVTPKGQAVMGGTGGGYFSPLMTYTREQAILTALRLFHCC